MLPVIIDHLDEILRGFTEIGILLIAYADLPGRMCRETVEPDPLRMLFYIVVWDESSGHLSTDHGKNGHVVGGFEQDRRTEAGIVENLIHGFTNRRFLIHHDERLVAEHRKRELRIQRICLQVLFWNRILFR